MSNLERAANEAVFHRQLNTRKAVEHVVAAARCAPADAERAVKAVAVAYKAK